MCGIVGHFSFQGDARLTEEKFRRLNAMQHHRGPDGAGVYVHGKIALGNCRLAIIDIDSGKQPMVTADGRYTIVFNGEIYNYRELRDELVNAGYPIKTQCDTEVLLYWYAAKGPAGLSRLNGMFAFAIWDEHAQELFLARDRMGVKPLYYATDAGNFFFASELTPIYASGLFNLTWDHEAISDYLAYWYVCEPKTIFKEIRQLPPAHYAIIKAGRLRIESWWQIPVDKEIDITFKRACEVLEGLLDDAIKIRMRADVPVGVFLSGGIDSGLITSFAREHTQGWLSAFSIGFKEKSYSELPLAQATAKRLGVDFYPMGLNPPSINSIQEVVGAFDEPLGNASFYPTYFLAQAASRQLKVVLSGDGADELFGGYPTYQAAYYQNAWRPMPGFMKNLIRQGIKRMPVNHGRISLDFRLKQLMKGVELSPAESHYTWREVMGLKLQSQLMRRELAGKISGYDPFEVISRYFNQASRLGAANQAMYADLNTYLLNDHLRKMDRMSMSHGLEARLPFMDYRIVEFAMRLPQAHKVNFRQTKMILKRIALGRLPAAVIAGKKKGLTPPIAHWLTKELKGDFGQMLQGGIVDDIFEPRMVMRLWDEHQQKTYDHSRVLWGLIVLNVWGKSLKSRKIENYANSCI